MSASQTEEADFTQSPDYGNHNWGSAELPHNIFQIEDAKSERKLAIEPLLTKFIGEEYYICDYAPGWNINNFQRNIIHPHGVGLGQYPSYADLMWSSVSGSKAPVSTATAAHVKYVDTSIDTLVQLTDVSEPHKRKLKRLLKHGMNSLEIDKDTNDRIDLSEFINDDGKFVFKANALIEFLAAIDAKKAIEAPFFSREIDMTLQIQVEGVEGIHPNNPIGGTFARGQLWWTAFTRGIQSRASLTGRHLSKYYGKIPSFYSKQNRNEGSCISRGAFQMLQQQYFIMFLKFINVEDTNQGDSILSCFNDVSALQDNHTCANRYYAALTILKSSLQAPASFAIIEASAAFRSQRYNPKGWAIDYINFLLQWQSVNKKHGNILTGKDLWNYFVPDFKAAHVMQIGDNGYEKELHELAEAMLLFDQEKEPIDGKYRSILSNFGNLSRYLAQMKAKYQSRISRQAPSVELQAVVNAVSQPVNGLRRGMNLFNGSLQEYIPQEMSTSQLHTLYSRERDRKTQPHSKSKPNNYGRAQSPSIRMTGNYFNPKGSLRGQPAPYTGRHRDMARDPTSRMHDSSRRNNAPYRLAGDYSNPPRERGQPTPLTRVNTPQPMRKTRPMRDLQERIALAQGQIVAAMQCQDSNLKDSELRKALQQMQQLTMQSDDIEPQPAEAQDHAHEEQYDQEPDNSDCEQDTNTGNFVDVEALIHAVQNADDDNIPKGDLLSLLQQNGASFTLQTTGSFLDEPTAQVMFTKLVIALALKRTIIDTGASIDCAPQDCGKFLHKGTFNIKPPIEIAMGKGKLEVTKGGLILRIFRNKQSSAPCLDATKNPFVAYVSVALITDFDNKSLDIMSTHVAKRLGLGLIIAPGQNAGITFINSTGSVQLDVQTADNGIPYLETHTPDETLMSSGVIDICTGLKFDLTDAVNRARNAFPSLLRNLNDTASIVKAANFPTSPPQNVSWDSNIRSFDRDAQKDYIADAYVQANITKSVYLTEPLDPNDSSLTYKYDAVKREQDEWMLDRNKRFLAERTKNAIFSEESCNIPQSTLDEWMLDRNKRSLAKRTKSDMDQREQVFRKGL